MIVGIVGLGRMGLAIAFRLLSAGNVVIGYDPSEEKVAEFERIGGMASSNISEVARNARIFWLMVPAGEAVDGVLKQLGPNLQKGDIVIDGGNSNFQDSIRRYKELKNKEIFFLDCGTSGGIHGKDLGFSLMVGGDREAFKTVEPIFDSLSDDGGYAYMGPSGSGHYVKMVHNGIEYALLQAYAEGFHMLKSGLYKDLDLEKICGVWNSGSIVRSWIVELARQVFEKDQDLLSISGEIGENKTGKWTVETAKEYEIPVNVIEQALNVRAWSRTSGGNYATKVVAMLRHQFGGHAVKEKCES